MKLLKKLLATFLSVSMMTSLMGINTLAATTTEASTINTNNSAVSTSRDVTLSKKIIKTFDDGSYVVETITLHPTNILIANSSIAKATIVYGTCSMTKEHNIYKPDNSLIARASLTASFKYNSDTDYISCTGKTSSYYVTSGSSTYFINKSLTTSSGGGTLVKKYVKAIMSYGYGIAGATNTLTIKCTSAGSIS